MRSSENRLRSHHRQNWPTDSPELNPDEQVWRDLKANAMGRSEILSREDLERKVTAHLEALKGLPKKVRSFFQLPMTRYAAL